jgi:predicted DNA-binding protein
MSKFVRIVIQIPVELKTKLDALKQQGYTTSGFIRATLERELQTVEPQEGLQRPDRIILKKEK